jgi:hypothetical protein
MGHALKLEQKRGRNAKQARNLADREQAHFVELAIDGIERDRLPRGIGRDDGGAAGILAAVRRLPRRLGLAERVRGDGALEGEQAAGARTVAEQTAGVAFKRDRKADGFAAFVNEPATVQGRRGDMQDVLVMSSRNLEAAVQSFDAMSRSIAAG